MNTYAVQLFAAYADLLGEKMTTVQLPAGATVRDLVSRIRERPTADRLPPAPLVAVNLKYARPDQVLQSGDDIALIPPVAGG